jgi:hypothetical protein
MLKVRKPVKHGQPWTPEEDARIKALAGTVSLATLAKMLERSSGSVTGRAALLGVKVSHRTPKFRD